MNIFDVIIILLVIGFGFIGFKKGFIKSLVSFLGIILVFVLSMFFKNPIAEFWKYKLKISYFFIFVMFIFCNFVWL